MKIYLLIAVVFLLLIILRYVIENKIHIKWKTFTKKGFVPKRGNFGLYCYTGQQGKGKTYSLAEYIYDNKDDCFFFRNINNINTLDDSNSVYFKGFKGLIDCKVQFDSGYYDKLINNKQVVFIFDELFTELTKGSKLSTDILDFISQLRKRKIIFLTTAQVWSTIPKEFRDLCRYQIDCNMISIGFDGLLFKTFRDAENMKWNNDLQEFEAPIVDTSLTKCRKCVSTSYNTLERITNTIITKNTNKTHI